MRIRRRRCRGRRDASGRTGPAAGVLLPRVLFLVPGYGPREAAPPTPPPRFAPTAWVPSSTAARHHRLLQARREGLARRCGSGDRGGDQGIAISHADETTLIACGLASRLSSKPQAGFSRRRAVANLPHVRKIVCPRLQTGIGGRVGALPGEIGAVFSQQQPQRMPAARRLRILEIAGPFACPAGFRRQVRHDRLQAKVAFDRCIARMPPGCRWSR